MSAWVDGAKRVLADVDGGSFTTSSRRAVWHTTQGLGMSGAIATYRKTKSWPHLTWDPRTGEIAQHIPATRAARALRNPAGGVQTNRHGALQIEVLAFAEQPFTSGPLRGLDRILAWLRSNGVPDTWPAGPPPAYGPGGRPAYGVNNGYRSTAAWAKTGHFGHSQVPENDHGDPGAISTTALLARPATPPAPAQAPVVVPAPEEDDMKAVLLKTRNDSRVWLIVPGRKPLHVKSQAALADIRELYPEIGNIRTVDPATLDTFMAAT